MIFELNTDNQAKELLEGQRRYKEMMASQYTAGYTDAEEKLNPVIKPVKPVIGTTAAVVETNSKMLAQKGCDEKIDYKNQTIKDTISYQNLKNNTTYTFLTELMVYEAGRRPVGKRR